MSCSNCDHNLPIVNKKYNLCNDCNFARTHNGRSRQDVYSERASLKPKKVYEFKRPTKPIKQQTKKESQVKKKLYEVKLEIETTALQNDEYFCKGCGISQPGLDKSHLLSIGQYKHLELVIRNIQLLCRKCHIIWEGKNISQMIKLNCFYDNLEIIKELDYRAYCKLQTLIEEYYANEKVEKMY